MNVRNGVASQAVPKGKGTATRTNTAGSAVMKRLHKELETLMVFSLAELAK
jgi:hypothetical protein